MKDLAKLFAECEADLAQVGFRPEKYRFSINTRAKKRWGCCRVVANGVYNIEISERLLADDVSDQATKNTIMHELIHAVEGCLSHTGKWKQIAEAVNHRFPNYTVKRCTSAEEKGIAPATVVRRNGSSCEYCIQCTKCGSRIIRERMSKAVQYPERYRCAKCGGDLVRVY